MSQIRNLLKQITDDKSQNKSQVCFIRDIQKDAKTVTVELVAFDFIESIPNEDNFIYDVSYSPSQETSTYTPAVLSYVYVAFFDDSNAYIVLSSSQTSVNLQNEAGDNFEVVVGNDKEGSDGNSLYIQSNNVNTKHLVSKGLQYSGNGKNASIDYGVDWSRSGAGSIILLDDNVNLTASHNGKISIVKKRNNLINERAESVVILEDTANVKSFLSLLELDRRIINIMYNGSSSGKPALYSTMFDNYRISDAEYIVAYESLFNELDVNFTEYFTNYRAPQLVKEQIKMVNELKALAGNLSNTDNIDKNTYETYQKLRSIILAAKNNNSIYETITFKIHKFIVTEADFVLFVDVILNLLNALSKYSNPVNYNNLIKILDDGESLFIGRTDNDNLQDYKNEEDNVIDAYLVDNIEISLGDILSSIQQVVQDIAKDVNTLATAGTTVAVTGATGVGTLNGLATFTSSLNIRLNELNRIDTDIKELLV